MADMDCRRARKMLMQEAAGALDERRSDALRRHLSACPGCRAELDGLREAGSVFARARPPLPEASASVWESVRGRIEASSRREGSRARRRLFAGGLGASLAAAALVAAGYLTVGTGSREGEGPPPVTLRSSLPQEAPPAQSPVAEHPAKSARAAEPDGSPPAGGVAAAPETAGTPPQARRSRPRSAGRPSAPASSPAPAVRTSPAEAVAVAKAEPPALPERPGLPEDAAPLAMAAAEGAVHGLIRSMEAVPGPSPEPGELEESARALEMVFTSPDARARTILDY